MATLNGIETGKENEGKVEIFQGDYDWKEFRQNLVPGAEDV